MKQVIGLVLLGLICSNVVLAEDETKTDGASHSGRIVNGLGVNIVNYGYALNMYYNNKFFCGASIITYTHALTAGHCVQPVMGDIAKIVLHGGSTSPTTGGFFFQVVRIALHGGYNPNAAPGTSDFDAAVVSVFTNGFKGRPNMVPIALQTSDIPVGTTCFVVGWGLTNINGVAPASDLRYANMNIVSQASCAAAWTPFPAQRVTSNMLCAKYGNGVDICKGDSGGGLVCGGRLSGIVSFTNPNCNSAWPAGFAKVTSPSIRSFIFSQTGI
ncbi:trypsin delta-like [Anopheles marshallii]|uniref:trypsin delta-like n=1 Tax=Anopheles marshallii TaxID=1521116 RepID=UPI00237C219C|nr:trypsin delta-like [Anopheles marshallii]